MAKRTKMRVVKKDVNSSNLLTNILLSPFYLIYYVLMILFAPPTNPSPFLGFIRLMIWGYALWSPNYTELYKVTGDDTAVGLFQNYWPLFILFYGLMFIYAFVIFCGLTSNSKTNNSSNYHPNIDTTMQIIDGRLSSPGNRGKVLKKLFDID